MARAKRVKGVDCRAPAAAGMRLVLRARLRELCKFREVALDWSDPEGVHSMRVASRRLRSVLRDFAPHLRKQGFASVQKRLKRIAGALGDVRDQDVAIMALEKMATGTPTAVPAALNQLIEARKEVRERAREELRLVLDKNELQRLQADFIAGVEKATAPRAQSTSETSYLEMSRAIMLERLKEFEELSISLFTPFHVEPLHELRIAAKRLRYALELFDDCWKVSLAPYAKRAARMQSALGEVHDCDVWIESFSKHRKAAKKREQREQALAFIWLLSNTLRLRTKYLRQAYAQWSEWEKQDVSAKLRAALDRPR